MTLNQITSLKDKRTFENTVKPIADFEADVANDQAPLSFYSSVAVSKEMREAAKAIDKETSDFNTDTWMREDLYLAM